MNLLQSKEWKKLQDDLGEKSIFEEGNGYSFLAIIKKVPTGNYLYLPYGPVYENKTGFKNALKSLEGLAKKEGAIFIRIEPQDPNFVSYAPKNAKKSKDLNPKETWLLDLTGNDYREKLPSRLLRYYKNAEKNGLTIETSKNPADIKHLLSLQKSLAKEKGISTFSENYLKTELSQPFATLYLVRYQQPRRVTAPEGDPKMFAKQNFGEGEEPAGPVGTVIASGLVFDYKNIRYNLQGAQSDEGRKLHATGILTIKLIEDAKAQNKTLFDFWGIAPENAPKNHPWAGFTNFKKTFDGYKADYAGTYDLVLNPFKYRFYLILRGLNRILRRTK